MPGIARVHKLVKTIKYSFLEFISRNEIVHLRRDKAKHESTDSRQQLVSLISEYAFQLKQEVQKCILKLQNQDLSHVDGLNNNANVIRNVSAVPEINQKYLEKETNSSDMRPNHYFKTVEFDETFIRFKQERENRFQYPDTRHYQTKFKKRIPNKTRNSIQVHPRKLSSSYQQPLHPIPKTRPTKRFILPNLNSQLEDVRRSMEPKIKYSSL